MPALPPYLIEPIWQQFSALLPERKVDHPLGCHRPRIPDRRVFEKLVQVLVFGCAYYRIADEGCSATTLRDPLLLLLPLALGILGPQPCGSAAPL